MKTRNLLFTMVAMLITSAMFAAGTPKLEIASKGSGKLLVLFEAEDACLLEIAISDESGNLAYKWNPENPEQSLKKLFNLSKLESGIYNLSVKYDNKTMNTPLNLGKEEIRVGSTVVTAKPYFKFRNNMLYITYLNKTLKGVYVNIYKNGTHYTGFYLGKEFDLQKCVNFETASRGNYEIILTSSIDSYSFRLKI